MEVKPLIAVIPVADLEQPFHHVAGHIFQQGGSHHAGAVNEKQIVFDWQGYPQHHDCAGAIKGQHGEPQKTTVDKMVLF